MSLPQYDKPPVPGPLITDLAQIGPQALAQLISYLEQSQSAAAGSAAGSLALSVDGVYTGQISGLNTTSTP